MSMWCRCPDLSNLTIISACTVQVLIGGAFERGHIIPPIISSFFWATIVYCPIACWTWNPNGWLFTKAFVTTLPHAGR